MFGQRIPYAHPSLNHWVAYSRTWYDINSAASARIGFTPMPLTTLSSLTTTCCPVSTSESGPFGLPAIGYSMCMDPEAPNPVTAHPSDNTTLTEVVDGYRAAGYDGDFFAEEDARVRCGSCQSLMPADQLTKYSMRRLEGASDPDDMVAVVATVCPQCDAHGTLVLGLGPMASGSDGAVMTGMIDRRGDDGALPPDASPHEMPVDVGTDVS